MRLKDCFRPLTGTLLSKHEIEQQIKQIEKDVSVPSRGLSYLNDKRVYWKNTAIGSFRPLTGTLLSKQDRGLTAVPKKSAGFRPLTGTLLSKRILVVFMEFQQETGFRPLTGTLLSKHHPPILPPQAAFFAGLRGK